MDSPPTTSIYGPTKHAVRSFSEVLRQELAMIENEKIRAKIYVLDLCQQKFCVINYRFKECSRNITKFFKSK